MSSGAIIVAPLRVRTANKWFSLNLNNYRNAHYYLLNGSKKAFKEGLLNQIGSLGSYTKCRIEYWLFVPNKRRCDVSNVCSVVDKYFSDALVELGKLPDDDYTHLPEVSYIYKGIDKCDPRVEIHIYPLD